MVIAKNISAGLPITNTKGYILMLLQKNGHLGDYLLLKGKVARKDSIQEKSAEILLQVCHFYSTYSTASCNCFFS